MLILTLTLPAAALRAEEDQAMRRSLELFKQGRGSFQAGQYEEAIRALKQAHQLYRHRNNLYYIAASYRRLGKLRRSFAVYSDYAATFTKLDKRRQLLRRYRHKLRDEPPCVLSVSGTPAGAEVLLDGAAAGRIPAGGVALRLIVKGGQHRVELRAMGHRPALWVVRAEFGEEQRRSLALARKHGREAGPTVRAPPRRPAGGQDQDGGFFLEVSVGPSNRSYGIEEQGAWGLDLAAAGGPLWRGRWLGLRLFAELAFASADAAGYAGYLCAVGGAAGRFYLSRQLWIELGLGLGTTLLLDAAPGVFFFHREGKQVLDIEGTFALLCLCPSLGLGVELWRGLSAALRMTIYHSPRIADFTDSVLGVTRLKLGLALAWTFR